MNREEFNQLTKSNIIFLDGATGSNLMKSGMPAGVCPEQWILENKQVLCKLQQEYVAAGSNIVYAPTFTANRIKLEEYGLGGQVREINHKLVALSKEAVNGKALVAGDISMTGRQLKPIGDFEFERLIDIYKEQIGYLAEAGVDLLGLETIMSLQEARAAVIAAKEVCDLPIMVTMTFESDGRTLYGTDAVTAAVVLESLGVSAVGVNCSAGPDAMLPLIRNISEVTSLPIIAKPNAGLPSLDADGRTVYDMDEEDFVHHTGKLLEAGAGILGGCCGTTPLYIANLVQSCRNQNPVRREKSKNCYLASERNYISFGLQDNFIIIGERINPTGKKKLQEELRQGSMEMVRSLAEEQEACGAAILDVNMGMSGIDESEMMLRAIEEISCVSSLPLSIDSSHIGVIEAALRRYPGRALINSISYEKVKFERLLPIAAKYGAMFILLPLSDEGLPKDLDEKKEIIEKIAKRAMELGMCKEDIVVDGLVTTVGANKNAAIETLETIRYCKEKGFATTCGLSNISFGLPERSYVNTTFLTMAIREGLTMAIANPSQELLMSCAFASDLLLNKENADIRYIEQMNRYGGRKEGKTFLEEKDSRPEVKEEKSAGWQVREAVLKGNKNSMAALTKTAITSGMEPRYLLDDFLLPAINEVGELFDKGKYFLPQLIASAETMKISIEYLEPLLLKDNDSEKAATVVIATVEGDIHDIGKNLVVLMLKNYGFHVIDLGKDVSKEDIMEAAIRYNADIIALSALMTTTMVEMKCVVELVRQKNIPARVIIGGAVITQEYADEIGADGYAKDAADTVRLIRKVLQTENIEAASLERMEHGDRNESK